MLLPLHTGLAPTTEIVPGTVTHPPPPPPPPPPPSSTFDGTGSSPFLGLGVSVSFTLLLNLTRRLKIISLLLLDFELFTPALVCRMVLIFGVNGFCAKTQPKPKVSSIILNVIILHSAGKILGLIVLVFPAILLLISSLSFLVSKHFLNDKIKFMMLFLII